MTETPHPKRPNWKLECVCCGKNLELPSDGRLTAQTYFYGECPECHYLSLPERVATHHGLYIIYHNTLGLIRYEYHTHWPKHRNTISMTHWMECVNCIMERAIEGLSPVQENTATFWRLPDVPDLFETFHKFRNELHKVGREMTPEQVGRYMFYRHLSPCVEVSDMADAEETGGVDHSHKRFDLHAPQCPDHCSLDCTLDEVLEIMSGEKHQTALENLELGDSYDPYDDGWWCIDRIK